VDGTCGRKSFGFRGGATFFLSANSSIIIGTRYGDGGFEQTSQNNFRSWSDNNINQDHYLSNTNRERMGNRFSINTTFEHKFSGDNHKLLADFQYSRRDGDEITTNRLFDNMNNANEVMAIVSGQKTTEVGPSRDFEFKVDYTLPIGANTKLEAGLESEFDNSDDITGLYQYDAGLQQFVFQPKYSNSVNYVDNTHALYTTYGGEIADFGYQAGLRAEYTDRKVTLLESSDKFTIDQLDYFPTAHFSYKLDGGNQVMASYTRRINRPRGWELEPFETFLDAYNVRKGNPSLKPEYLDSYELGYQTMFDRSVFSIEAYYKFKDNKIERIRSAYADNITLETTNNVGADYSFGSELMFNFDPVEGWNANLMGNLYHYRIEGRLYGNNYSRESFNWNTRFNNNIKFGDLIQLQINTMYNSPSVSAQGRREGFFEANVALRKDFFNKVLSATLQLRNILGTANWESLYESDSYYSYNLTERESPMITLNLRYNFNMKPKRDSEGGGDGMLGGEGGGF
jgi:outer membrane receptor protein involved in Fe transport